MHLEPLVFAAAAFVTVVLFVWALAPVEARRVRERLSLYGYHDEPKPPPLLEESAWTRLLLPLIARLGQIAERVTPAHIRAGADALLEQAGRPLDAGQFLALRLASMVLIPAYLLTMMTLSAEPPGLTELAVLLLAVWVGMRAPVSWLKLKAEGRRGDIERALPDSMDLVIVCMEAGMGFDASLHKVVEKTAGPLRDELERTLQEISLGKLRRDALRDMARRCAVPDLNSVVGALVQADQMGLSVAHVLRAQADDLRVKRRQRAEETAQKAPVKMLFPLVFCIFPAMMLVTLGPAIEAIYTNIIVRLGE